MPSIAIRREGTAPCLDKIVELPHLSMSEEHLDLNVQQEENWPCFLLWTALDEVAEAILESLSG